MSTPASINFAILEHGRAGVAESIRAVLFAGYAVEAAIIGRNENFFPLLRTAEHIRRTASTFIGAFEANADDTAGRSPIAVAELEIAPEAGAHGSPETARLNIASFVVHPDWFRCGVGSALLDHIVATHGQRPVAVSTAAANGPAVGFYEKHGFVASRHWTTEDGISMVTLSRRS